MYIDFKSIKGTLVVSLDGELDHHTAHELRIKIDDRIDRFDVKNLILDFSDVTFMDSSGIGVVIGRYKKLSVRKGTIKIANVSKNIKRIFDLSGICKVINVYESVDKALNNA
ncbi:MAG: anti-sigma F factor antagonist [Sarcina sp.]